MEKQSEQNENETFQPGDIVRLVASPGMRIHIVERLEQTCPGGTQIIYVGRMHSHSNWTGDVRGLERFNCVEVEAIETAEAPATGSVLELLTAAKELSVSECNFTQAAEIRDLHDDIKKGRYREDSEDI